MTEAGKGTYALSTLFGTDYSHDTTRVYRWGYLAVRYMLEKHPADMDKVLGHYRTGQWAAARTYLTSTIGTRYDSDFRSWLAGCAAGDCGSGGDGAVAECTDPDTRVLGENCRRSNLSATKGNYAYHYLYIPAGTRQLKITVSGGTGDADLYYSASGWATTASATQRATGTGNSHTLTVNNPRAGAHYISLYAASAFGGATLTTAY